MSPVSANGGFTTTTRQPLFASMPRVRRRGTASLRPTARAPTRCPCTLTCSARQRASTPGPPPDAPVPDRILLHLDVFSAPAREYTAADPGYIHSLATEWPAITRSPDAT